MPRGPSTKVITVTLSPEQFERAHALATELETTISELVRSLLREKAASVQATRRVALPGVSAEQTAALVALARQLTPPSGKARATKPPRGLGSAGKPRKK
jgi:hypothetical protein